MQMRPLFVSGLTIALALSGCRGEVYDDGPDRPGRAARCGEGDALPAAAPLRRLTPREYSNTLRDLFAPLVLPNVTFPETVAHGRFDTDSADQVVSPLWVERSQSNAEEVAATAVADRGWMNCGARDAATCAREVLPELFSRAYRRPLEDAERTAISDFYNRNEGEFGEAVGLQMTLEALLISPDFLYRPEMHDLGTAPAGFVALDDHELSARLSYLLWGTMPDAELRRAADAGELSVEGGMEAQARRMIDDPRARATTRAFFEQWMELDRLDGAYSDSFPEFDGQMKTDLRASVLRFAEDAFWDGRSYEALINGSYGYVNDRLAPTFGVAPPGSEALVRVELDPSQRAGVLTQPGWLASGTHGATHSPIIRGLFLVRNVLCGTIDPPPADVTTDLPDDVPTEIRTTRQLIELTHGTAECASCHAQIDGAGFAFENYNGIGGYQTQEDGADVDASALIIASGDANGIYPDALAMIAAFSESERVRECMVTQIYRSSVGRQDQEGDACQVRTLSDALAENDDPTELLIGIATSPSFRYRPEVSE